MSREAPLLSTIVNRLRGIYTLGVNDGAGPLDGKDTFTRKFETPPIHQEAADAIEALLAAQTKSLSDKDDVYSEAIIAAHPTNSNKHDDPMLWKRYTMAMDMIGNRHGKYALIDLVNWLLKESAVVQRRYNIVRLELEHLVRLLEPQEKAGTLDVPGLATLNGARKALAA